MKTARVFLSHASPDKPLVREVATALARRGVLAWLDVHELRAGDDLSRALTRAVETQSLLALFLSKAALDRPWVHDELNTALAIEDQARATGRPQPVIPVYLDDALSMVRRHPLLRSRWLHPNGDRVDRLGICASPEDALAAQAEHIAKQIADRMYGQLAIDRADDLALVLDQRGEGPRRVESLSLPSNLATSDIPALVFRPDLAPRTTHQVVQGQAWTALVRTLSHSVSTALGTRRPVPPKIRILGNSQLALAFALGTHLDRTRGAKLYAYARDGLSLALDLGAFDTPLAGGDAARAQVGEALIAATQATRDLRPDTLVLLIMHHERYMRQAVAAVRTRDSASPIAWLPHPAHIDDATQIVALARDIKAFIDHVDANHVELAASLPFHAVPLLGALLTPHVFGSVTFLEHVRGGHDSCGDYVRLPIF